ncbi:hypothetical protein DFH06DRAFT_1133849 [Mycena polygramma]|nr:hypothetical protein DFH06DRAFT_1133849 [Mycena polygramma]
MRVSLTALCILAASLNCLGYSIQCEFKPPYTDLETGEQVEGCKYVPEACRGLDERLFGPYSDPWETRVHEYLTRGSGFPTDQLAVPKNFETHGSSMFFKNLDSDPRKPVATGTRTRGSSFPRVFPRVNSRGPAGRAMPYDKHTRCGLRRAQSSGWSWMFLWKSKAAAIFFHFDGIRTSLFGVVKI